jgi:putative redox protein
MVEIAMVYDGDLRCSAVHVPSGTKLVTDAPADNQGKGEFFSPTDLVATALGTCILTTMAIVAKNMNVDLQGAKLSVKKEMAALPTRRIKTLTVVIEISTPLDDVQKQKLINAASKCPVHKSLHPDVAMPIEFHWT